MGKELNSLWAKKDEKNGMYYWLPLSVHLKDTMYVAGWLWNHWLADGQRQYLVNQMQTSSGERADEETAENLVRFLGAIHDIGKAAPAFQIKKGYSASPDLDMQILENLEKSGFTDISKKELPSGSKSPHALAGEVILHDLGYKDDIASIVGAHHGKPISGIEVYDEQRAYPSNYYQSENKSDQIVKKWKNVRKEILKPCWETKDMEVLRRLRREQPITNLAELYTNWSRAITLNTNQVFPGSVKAEIAKLPEIIHVDQFLEPMTIWRWNESGDNKGHYTPKKHVPEQAMWRSFGLMVLPSSEEGKQKRPGVQTQMMKKRKIVGDQMIALRTVSMQDDGNATSWMGKSLGTGRSEDQKKALDRRFNAMITAADFDEFTYHLRQMVKLVKSKTEIFINYPELANDLYWYQCGKKDKICFDWATSYYGRNKINQNEAGEGDENE